MASQGHFFLILIVTIEHNLMVPTVIDSFNCMKIYTTSLIQTIHLKSLSLTVLKDGHRNNQISIHLST